MGIARGAARLLLNECQQRPFSGSVLQLGRQSFFFEIEELQKWASWHDVKLAKVSIARSHKIIDDITFFSALGFESVESLDISDYEGATHILDLNCPIPKHLYNRYDVIVDGGTIEHIFHFPQVLSNIYDMLKVGGRVIHLAPSSNHVDHGFYMFSPTLFYDYYTCNQWIIDDFKIFEYTMRHDVDAWRIYNYNPGCLSRVSFGGFDRGYLLGIYCVALKTKDSTKKNIPQQGYYKQLWSNTETDSTGITQVQKLAQMLEPYPKISKMIKRIYHSIPRSHSRKMPPLIAKY